MCSLKITSEGAQPNYHGPYKVLERKVKYFKVQLPKGPDTISVDRLKVAYYDEENLIKPSINPQPLQFLHRYMKQSTHQQKPGMQMQKLLMIFYLQVPQVIQMIHRRL